MLLFRLLVAFNATCLLNGRTISIFAKCYTSLLVFEIGFVQDLFIKICVYAMLLSF